MSLEQRSKKELAEMVRELQEKLLEMKGVEKHVSSTATDLKSYGVGLYKDSKGVYHLAKIKFDAESKAALVEELVSVGSEESMALYRLKEYSVETVMRKTRGGKYV